MNKGTTFFFIFALCLSLSVGFYYYSALGQTKRICNVNNNFLKKAKTELAFGGERGEEFTFLS